MNSDKMELTGYLSDEELMALILDIEENDLAAAPPDFTSQLLMKLPDEKNKVITILPDRRKPVSKKNKRREFQSYCLRVGLSVAASIAILFAGPGMFKEMKPVHIFEQKTAIVQEIESKEDVLKGNGIFSKSSEKTGIFFEENDHHLFMKSEVK